MISFQEFKSKCTSQRWSNSRELSFRAEDDREYVEVLEGDAADDPKAILAAHRKMYKTYSKQSEPEPEFNVAERFHKDVSLADLFEPTAERTFVKDGTPPEHPFSDDDEGE